MKKNHTLLKLCGFKKQEDVDFAASLGVEFLGFVFWEKSKRWIKFEEFASLNLEGISSKIVAVFQEPTLDEILTTINANRVDFIQIHNSTPKFGQEIAKIRPVIWCFHGENFTEQDFENANFASYFLFDGTQAGSGIERDFNFAKNIKNLTEKQFFLAGGINIANFKNALQYSNMLDVSSGIEIIAGVKDQEKIKELLNAMQNEN